VYLLSNRGGKTMRLFGKKKEEEMQKAIVPEETEEVSIGIPKETKKSSEEINDYYNKNYAGITDREILLNTPTLEVTATTQDLLYAIYAELRKLNKGK
jgi:hypothetical protein